ncbi:hypothetical protein GUITHDRAFT_114135 [Guillardia theta CCMP2712]|uniref:Uncharacterized protein n=1 Tax=Guillardia theta (strain CCMP2712) TaxID=905079 RepID=L1IUG0_GUITC|nr:hypothetical protein GUITHDRAFT_114135 [Guillardia theta CCMP2712]EKX39886.1 hypothetical protein GUITHDRAFT_114135 [Guillardia theta CCMP2712]|eukprot:XP_005826866.1 hypothetical protein GUITHDRAFT_114135 [Guillardia theta CCMP2712]
MLRNMWPISIVNPDEIVQYPELMRRLDEFARQNPKSRTSKALKAKEISLEALAEAISQTCSFAEPSSLENPKGLRQWGDDVRQWYLSEFQADRQRQMEARSYDDQGTNVQTITMKVLGIPAYFSRQVENLCLKLEEQGLIVDQTQDSRSLIFKAPLKPDLVQAAEIPAVITFVRNEAAEKLWKGEGTFKVAGRRILAVNPAANPPISFKMRPKKENMGRVGILAEVAQLLMLNDSSTGDICEIYSQLCLKQGLAIIDLIPNAGMTVNLPPKRNLPPKKVFAAVGIETVNQNREVDWIATCPSLEAADIVLQAFDRHGKDRAGVTLGLVSENDKILKWFSVQMEATALHKNMKNAVRQEGTAMATGAEMLYSVQISSPVPSGKFSRNEIEKICASDETGRAKVIRNIRRAVACWDPQVEKDLQRIHLQCDPETGIWDGSGIILRLRNESSARKMMAEFPTQLLCWQGTVEIQTTASSLNLQVSPQATRDQSNPEARSQATGTRAEGTVWKEIELSSIINETNLPDAGTDVVVEELKEAIADVSRSELQQQGQLQLHLDDAVQEMAPESPGNASFPTLQEWADKGANEAENAMSKRLRDRVRVIAGKHTWKVAKRKNSAFAPNEEKPLKTDLLFIALNKFLEETALSLVGMLGDRNELKLVLSSEIQMEDARVEDAPEAGSKAVEVEEMSLDSSPTAPLDA